MAVTRKTAHRLIMALNMKGAGLKYTEKTFYSQKYKRILTKYKVMSGEKQIISTYRLADLIKKLGEMMREADTNGA